MDRIFTPVPFSGDVVPGWDYLLVDDVLTQGGTFAGLANFIGAGQGRVRGIVALTGNPQSARLALSDATLAELRVRRGGAFRDALGYGFGALTESEARYLAEYRSADAIRDRITAAKSKGGSNIDGGGDGSSGSGSFAPLAASPLPRLTAMTYAMRRQSQMTRRLSGANTASAGRPIIHEQCPLKLASSAGNAPVSNLHSRSVARAFFLGDGECAAKTHGASLFARRPSISLVHHFKNSTSRHGFDEIV